MLLAATLAALALLPQGSAPQTPASQEPKFEMETYQFVMLVNGPNFNKVTPADASKMQAEHLKGLEKLWNDGKALVVGPVINGDTLRGIVVLDVRTKEEGAALLKDDPFVKAGVLSAEVRPWLAGKNLVKKGPKFMDLAPVWLGLLKRPKDAPTLTKEESAKVQAGHMANIDAMAKSGALIWAGPFLEDTPLRGVFVFRNLPREEVLKMASEDAAIKAKRLELELFTWVTSKGTWPEK